MPDPTIKIQDDFEGDFPLTGWIETDPGFIATYAVVNSPVYSGQKAIAIAINNFTGIVQTVDFYRYFDKNYAHRITAGFQYEYRVRFMVRLSTAVAGLVVRPNGVLYSGFNWVAMDPTIPNTWQSVEANTISDIYDDQTLTVALRISSIPVGANFTLYVDWVRVEQINYAPGAEGALPTAIVFPWEPSDAGPLLERHEWLTVVNSAQEDSERRAQIRNTARTSLRFGVIPEGRERGTLDAQAWKHTAQRWKVPWWSDQGTLTATMTGSRWVDVVTTNRLFVVGQEFILYNNWADYVVLPVLEVEATRIRYRVDDLGPYAGLFKANVARAIPLRVSLMAPSRGIDRETYNGAVHDVEFIAEPPSPVTVVALTQYRGKDLLTMDHNARDTMEEQLSWTTDRMDTNSGVFRNRTPSPTPVISRSFSWFAPSRSEINTLRGFLDSRRGRRVGFWMPTFHDDLPLSADVGSGAGAVIIQKVGYTTDFFTSTSRRDIVLIDPIGLHPCRVTASVDNGDGTETLTIDIATTRSYSIANSMVSLLLWCRLEEDTAEIEHHTSELAEASFQFTEVPREIPA